MDRRVSMAIENFQCARNFQNRSSQVAGKRYFEFGFCTQQSHSLIQQNTVLLKTKTGG